jgi:hypothetical protein
MAWPPLKVPEKVPCSSLPNQAYCPLPGLSGLFCGACLIARFHDQYVLRGSYLYVVLWIVLFQLAQFTFNQLADNSDDLSGYYAFGISGSFSGLMAAVMATFWTYFARRAFRKRYLIPVGAR